MIHERSLQRSMWSSSDDSSKSATEAALTSYPKERSCRMDGSILVKNEEARRSVRVCFGFE